MITKILSPFFFLAGIFTIAIYMMMIPGPFSAPLIRNSLTAILISVVLFFLYSSKTQLKGYYLKPSNLFIIGYCIVNFQYIIDFLLGYKFANTRFITHADTLNQCAVLGLIGLFAFIAGYSSNFKIRIKEASKTIKNNREQYSNATQILFFLQLLFFIGFLATINIVSFLTGLDYVNSESNNNSEFEGLLYVTNILIILNVIAKGLALKNIRQYLSSFPKLSLFIILIYMIMRLISGDRGPFIYTVLLLFYGYCYATRKKIKIQTIIILLAICITGVSVIGIARGLDSQTSFFSRFMDSIELFSKGGRFGNGMEKQSFFTPTEELGFSFLVNQEAVNSIEKEGKEYNWGTYSFYSLIFGIPFMPGIVQNQLDVPPENCSSVSYIDNEYFGTQEKTWSLGTTILSDLYLQFGSFGVFIGLMITGIIFNYIDKIIFVYKKSNVSIYLLLFALTFASKSIYMPRAVLFADLARFVWGAIIIWTILKFRLFKAKI